MNTLFVVSLVDDLYRRAVDSPQDIDESLLIEWMEQASDATGFDRQQAKVLRKVTRIARKLAAYWQEHDGSGLPDWRNGVDEMLGGRGWQCQLDILTNGLEAAPDEELFDAAKERHRAAHFTEWMEGVSYEEWFAGR